MQIREAVAVVVGAPPLSTLSTSTSTSCQSTLPPVPLYRPPKCTIRRGPMYF